MPAGGEIISEYLAREKAPLGLAPAPASHAAEKMRKAGSLRRDPAFRLTLGLVSGLANVGGLDSLRAPRHFELDLVTLGQALEALGLDGAEVHEHVLAVFLGDKAIPLRIVEPLHASLSHFYDLSLRRTASVMPRHHDGGALRNRRTKQKHRGT